MPGSTVFLSRKIALRIFEKIIFSFFLLFSLALQSQVLNTNLEEHAFEKIWIGIQTIDSGFAHSGFHYSKVDSINVYGLGLESDFPEESKYKNTWVKFSGWVKSERVHDELIFVFTIKNDNQTYYWKGVHLKPLLLHENEWFPFVDSVLVPALLTDKAQIKAFLWNSDKKNTAGIDDLEFTFRYNQDPSFIPEIKIPVSLFSNETRALFQNQFYHLLYDAGNHSIALSGKEKQLFSQLLFFSKTISKKYEVVEEVQNFRLVSEKKTDLGVELRFTTAKGKEKSDLLIICHENNGELKFSVKTKLKKSTEVLRQSIVLDMSQELEEVYRANRKSDTANFQHEYWLGKEGVKFGEGRNSIATYHNPDISSMQLLTSKNQLWINLDYEKDHPFLHFPLNSDSTDWKEDWSANKSPKKIKREIVFSFFAGLNVGSLPRFMKTPTGYLATYIWTEHADFTDIRTNRATYFGSEKIMQADSSTGGFLKYNIPVTKSIFYNNIDKISNASISGNKFQTHELSFLEDNKYQDFLFQLKNKNIEICLHTPEHFTTTSEQLEEALSGTREHFQLVSWIDHGYNNHQENNREDLVCDGTLPGSPYYAADLWKKYGVIYFWNSYYEDYFTFSGWDFSSSFEKPYSGFGDFIPNPDYWQNQRTPGIWHWPTKSVLYIENDALWEYNFNPNKLQNFVDDWAVEINHCYPAWVDPAKGFWVYDTDSTIVAAPGFNLTLERMATFKKEGKLNLTTIRDFMDYQLSVSSVNYQIQPDGRVKITNIGSKEIKGLSFATKGAAVSVDNRNPKQKTVNGEIIFWFDLQPGESKLLRIIP